MRTVSVGDTIGMLQEFGGVAAGEKCLVIAVSPQLMKVERMSNYARFHMSKFQSGITFEVMKPQPRSHRKKFVRGMQVTSTGYFADLVALGEWVYFNGKAYHPAFLMGWNLRSIQNYINRGMVYRAIRINP